MIFVDAHVHIYDCFDVAFLFDSALRNFQEAADKQKNIRQVSFVLLLTEGARESWFQNVLTNIGQDAQGGKKISQGWCCLYTEETDSLTVYRNDSLEDKMEIVRGFQIITREKIEVLALFCNNIITHGLSLDETLDLIERSGAIGVLPWGAGKWIGGRGKIIKRFLADCPERRLFLGDNGGRPLFWPTPELFHFGRRAGVSVLPGTDPLPLPAEAARVGSYGFYLDAEMTHNDSPTIYLKNALLSQQEDFTPFGRLQSSRSFFLNQLRLRFSS